MDLLLRGRPEHSARTTHLFGYLLRRKGILASVEAPLWLLDAVNYLRERVPRTILAGYMC